MLNFIKLIMVTALTSFSANTSAYLLADVGPDYDSLIGQATLSNSGSEETWVEDTLTALMGSPVDITYNQLTDAVSDGSNWQSVIGGVSGDYAFDFGEGTDPDYFLVKVGGGNGTNTVDTHFLYDNEDSMRYAFVNLIDFGPDVSLTNIDVISHAGTIDGGNVPEPGIISLLAIGLIGMGAVRRRTKA